MRFIHRIYLLLFTLVLFVAGMMFVGWKNSSDLLTANTTAYQEGVELTNTIDLARQAQVSFQRQVQEWKNVLIRSHTPELNKKYYKGFEFQEAQMDKYLVELKAKLRDLDMNQQVYDVEKLLADHKAMGGKYREALEAHPPTNYENQMAVDAMVRGIDRATSKGMDELVAVLQGEVAQSFTVKSANMQEKTIQELQIVGATVAGLLGLFLVLFLWTGKKLVNHLGAQPENAVEAAGKMARGDFTERMNARDPNSLIGALEMMQMKLRNIILAINEVGNEMENQSATLQERNDRDKMRDQVKKLREAAGRIKVSREGAV